MKRDSLRAAAWLAVAVAVASLSARGLLAAARPNSFTDCDARKKLVGISHIPYLLTHDGAQNFDAYVWRTRWGTPVLGPYDSRDPYVIRKHAEWFQNMHVDFLRLDWTNNQDRPENERSAIRGTDPLFAEYEKLDADPKLPRPPRLVIALGAKNQDVIGSGELAREADLVYRKYGQSRVYLRSGNKPVLFVFIPPATYHTFKRDEKTQLPLWSDTRFTLRWMTGFLDAKSHQGLRDERGYSRGMWSTIDRDPVVPVMGTDGCVEAVTVAGAYPGARGWLDKSAPYPVRGRERGLTFDRQWKAAIGAKPQIIYLRGWNQFSTPRPPAHGDQYSPELSNDLEPTDRWGFEPMEQAGELIARWKGILHQSTGYGRMLGRIVVDDNGNGRYDDGEPFARAFIDNPTDPRACGNEQFELQGHAVRYRGPLNGAVAANLCNGRSVPGSTRNRPRLAPYYRTLLPPGSYELSLQLPTGWQPTRRPASVTIEKDKDVHVWFFVNQCGVAPQSQAPEGKSWSCRVGRWTAVAARGTFGVD